MLVVKHLASGAGDNDASPAPLTKVLKGGNGSTTTTNQFVAYYGAVTTQSASSSSSSSSSGAIAVTAVEFQLEVVKDETTDSAYRRRALLKVRGGGGGASEGVVREIRACHPQISQMESEVGLNTSRGLIRHSTSRDGNITRLSYFDFRKKSRNP